MATTDLIGAQMRTDRAALPQAARDAMARLELAFAAPHIVRAVTRYEVAAARYDELIAKPASALKPAEVDAIGHAQQVIAESFGILAEAGMHHLVVAATEQTVANFDNHGSLWGHETVEKTLALIAWERSNGTDIDEWDTTDRDGQTLRIVRLADPTFLDTICVFSTWDTAGQAVAA